MNFLLERNGKTIQNLIEEIWKDIEGYENKYRVSNLGNVKSLNYNNTGKENLLKKRINKHGYYEVKLSKNNKTKCYLVSTLVAKAFVNNKNNYTNVTHIDKNKLNDCADNLKWIYREEILLFNHKDYKNDYKLSYNGKAYKGYKDLIKDYKISSKLFFKRLYRGWTIDEIITIPNQTKGGGKPLFYEYNGKMMTLSQIAEITGIDKKLIQKRLNRHWNIYEASEIPNLRKEVR